MVIERLAPAGTRVKPGDVVAEFDREDVMTRIEEYENLVGQAEANLRKLKSQLQVSLESHEQLASIAQSNVEKARLNLKTVPVQSAIDAEILQLAVEEAEAYLKQLLTEAEDFEASQRAQVRLSELELEQSRVELERIKANADKLVVRAPIPGLLVMETTFRSGQFDQVKEGDESRPGMAILKIVDTDSMLVEASVNQTDIDSVRLGARATVRFDAFSDLSLPASVYSIGAVAKGGGNRAEYVQSIPVVLKIEKLDPRVIPDLTVSVDLVLASERGIAIAPRESVFTQSGSSVVYVKRVSGWEPQQVELGLANHVAVAVRSGLREGDTIACQRPVERRIGAQK